MKIFLLFLLLCIFNPIYAQEGRLLIPIGQAGTEKSKIVFLDVTVPKNLTTFDKKLIKEFMLLLNTDFSFYKSFFEVMPQPKLKNSWGSPRYNYWRKKKCFIGNKGDIYQER